MKKMTSILLVVLLGLYIIPTKVLATENNDFYELDISQYTDSELDLTQYTMDDIINMTPTEYLGRCLHYVQDVNVPHHAANVISLGLVGSHAQFEKFAFENAESYLGSYTTIPGSFYTMVNNSSVATLTHNAAVFSKARIDNVDNVLDKTQWGTNADACLEGAARYSAMVLYKFSRVASVPFYSN